MEKTHPSLREFNMAKRRDRILHEARKFVAHGGFETLNLRALASAAEVTVPTIYNLVGNKEAIVLALFEDALSEIEQRVGSHRDTDPLDMTEAVVTESIGVFEEDEGYYRAAFIAVEYLDQSGPHHDSVAKIYQWGERLIIDGLSACAAVGLIQGRIPAIHLGEQILRSYRTSCRAWAFGQISIQQFRSAALTDVYICLAADAVETFHATLIKKIAALSAAIPSNAPRADQSVGVPS
ncbi:MAG: AcrR family transcriptional regulator [Gammaproteobacteria bacterium]|jgi:AcrR family transcriptional regulator